MEQLNQEILNPGLKEKLNKANKSSIKKMIGIIFIVILGIIISILIITWLFVNVILG